MNDKIEVRTGMTMQIPDLIFMEISPTNGLKKFIGEYKNKRMREQIILNAPEESSESANDLRLLGWQKKLQEECSLGSIFLDLGAFEAPKETEFLEPQTLEETICLKIRRVEKAIKYRIHKEKLTRLETAMKEIGLTKNDVAEHFDLHEDYED